MSRSREAIEVYHRPTHYPHNAGAQQGSFRYQFYRFWPDANGTRIQSTGVGGQPIAPPISVNILTADSQFEVEIRRSSTSARGPSRQYLHVWVLTEGIRGKTRDAELASSEMDLGRLYRTRPGPSQTRACEAAFGSNQNPECHYRLEF